MTVVVRMWKEYGITHAVHQVGLPGGTVTACHQWQPNLPWRNTQRFSLQRIDCMGCIAAMSEGNHGLR